MNIIDTYRTLHHIVVIYILNAVESTKFRFSSKAQQIFQLPHHLKTVFMVMTMSWLISSTIVQLLSSIHFFSNNYYRCFFFPFCFKMHYFMQVAFSAHTAFHTYTVNVSQTRVSMCVTLATYTTKRRALMHKRKENTPIN